MGIKNSIGSKKRLFGDTGERKAANFLKKKGYKILEKNYKSKFGEIDIIANNRDNVLIFCEVKTRSSNSFGYGYESVNKTKQSKIIRTAEFYISTNYKTNSLCRFDIISIDEQKITHIENAFL